MKKKNIVLNLSKKAKSIIDADLKKFMLFNENSDESDNELRKYSAFLCRFITQYDDSFFADFPELTNSTELPISQEFRLSGPAKMKLDSIRKGLKEDNSAQLLELLVQQYALEEETARDAYMGIAKIPIRKEVADVLEKDKRALGLKEDASLINRLISNYLVSPRQLTIRDSSKSDSHEIYIQISKENINALSKSKLFNHSNNNENGTKEAPIRPGDIWNDVLTFINELIADYASRDDSERKMLSIQCSNEGKRRTRIAFPERVKQIIMQDMYAFGYISEYSDFEEYEKKLPSFISDVIINYSEDVDYSALARRHKELTREQVEDCSNRQSFKISTEAYEKFDSVKKSFYDSYKANEQGASASEQKEDISTQNDDDNGIMADVKIGKWSLLRTFIFDLVACYADLPYSQREWLMNFEVLKNIKAFASKTGSLDEIHLIEITKKGSQESIIAFPYRVISDTPYSSNFLIYFTVDDKRVSVDSIPVLYIQRVETIYEQYQTYNNLKYKDDANRIRYELSTPESPLYYEKVEEKINMVDPFYISDEVEQVDICLTQYGKFLYCTRPFSRPRYIKICESRYTFKGSWRQIKEYFKPFGKEAELQTDKEIQMMQSYHDIGSVDNEFELGL